MLITRPPEAAESQYIIVSSSIMHKEKISILFCYSGTVIPLLLCKSRHSAYSTTFAFTLLLHTYDTCIQGINLQFQYLIMCRIKLLQHELVLGYVVDDFMHFLCIYCYVYIIQVYCNPIPTMLGYNLVSRLLVPQ